MKSIFLSVLFLLITIGALAQKKVTEVVKRYHPKTTSNPTAILESEGEMIHILNKYGNKTSSYRNGVWKFYYSNGNLNEQVEYKEDKMNGFFVRYGVDGSLLIQGEYKMNLKVGIWKTYSDGKLSSETSYANGIENGNFVSYVNGKVAVTGEYRNGIKVNRWLRYDENGNRIGQAIYDQAGLKKGKWEIPSLYLETITFGEYQNDERVGVWSVRNTEGKIIQTVDFDKGVSTHFYTSGKKLAELTFSMGTSGKIALISFNAYNENGTKRIEGEFNSSKMYSEDEVMGTEEELKDLLDVLVDYYDPEIDKDDLFKKISIPGYAVAIGIWKFYWDDGELATEYNLYENRLIRKSTRLKEKLSYSNGNYGKGNHVLIEVDFKLFEKQFLIKINNLNLLDKKSDDILGYVGPAFNFGNSHRSGIWETYDSTGVLLNKANYDFVTNKIRGSFTAYYPNGKVKSQGEYDKDGKQTGTWTYYYSNGNKAEERPMENGKITGVVTNYFENGKVKDKGAFVEGKRVGVVEYFHPNGQVLGKRNYRNGEFVSFGDFFDENGTVSLQNGTGSLTEYFDNGAVSFKGNYLNGKLHGNSSWYFTNGKLSTNANYSNGILNGTYQGYFESGSMMEKTPYVNGKISGTAEYYHPNGKILGRDIYRNGDFLRPEEYFDENGKSILSNGSGLQLTYHNNGKINLRMTYLDYCRNGKAQWYFSNGQLKQEAIYKYSEAHKPFGLRWEIVSSFDESGKPLEKGTLKEGNGTWISYDNGKKVVTEYVNGVVKK